MSEVNVIMYYLKGILMSFIIFLSVLACDNSGNTARFYQLSSDGQMKLVAEVPIKGGHFLFDIPNGEVRLDVDTGAFRKNDVLKPVSWNRNPDGSGEVLDINSPADKDWYAVNEISKCVVTFETYGGEQVAEQYVNVNQKASRPTDPEKGSELFINWYKTESLDSEFDFNIPLEHGTTVYAKWMNNYPLCFTVAGNGSVCLKKFGNPYDVQLEYSYEIDSDYLPYTLGDEIILMNNARVFIRAKDGGDNFSKSEDDYYQFELSGSITASGNVMSLLDKNLQKISVPSFCFCKLFDSCSSLVKAPDLPATQLELNCYDSMFSGCTGLTEIPLLPAVNLSEKCYYKMFAECTGLTEIPELPADILADSCYMNMFNGCTGLTKVPALPAKILASNCYNRMFAKCTGLTETPELPVTSLTDSCYSYMFDGCTALTKASKLPATELKENCYFSMFSDCTCLTEAPEILASSLVAGCCSCMFTRCTNLSKVTVLFNEWAEPATVIWLQGAGESVSEKYFYCHEELGTNDNMQRDVDHVPVGWAVVNI